MRWLPGLLLLNAVACAAPAPPPPIPHEAEAAPPHIMSAVRELLPDIAVHGVNMEGEVFVIAGALRDGDTVQLRVAQLGGRWKVVELRRSSPSSQN